jgi:hypothetical protein
MRRGNGCETKIVIQNIFTHVPHNEDREIQWSRFKMRRDTYTQSQQALRLPL